MRHYTRQVTRIGLIVFAGLLIATALPARDEQADSMAASLPAATPIEPGPRVYFAPTRTAPTGAQPFIVILCRFADAAETPLEAVDFERLLFGEGGVDAYWREASYGRISLAGSRVVGWYHLLQPAAAYQTADGSGVDLYRVSLDCAAAADADVYFPDYFGIGMVFNPKLNSGPRGGNACLELDGASNCYGAFWLPPDDARNRGVVSHEIGHTFGLGHSMAMDEAEYGDAWDLMSRDGRWWPEPDLGPLPQHMIGYDKDVLGCIGAERKLLVTSGTQTITLERLAQPGADGYLLAQIPIAGSTTHFYTVEARRRVGFDAHLPADAVVIHEIDTGRPIPAMLINRTSQHDFRDVDKRWQPGQRFTDEAHGITIAVDAETETGFVVTLSINAQP